MTPTWTAARARRDAQAAELQRIVNERRVPVSVAAQIMGLTPTRTNKLRRLYRIKAPPGAVEAHKRVAFRNNPQRAQKAGLSEAQQSNIVKLKRAMWRGAASLPPITEDEAARLIAEHIRKHGVTKCPPAAEVVVPINSGVGFR